MTALRAYFFRGFNPASCTLLPATSHGNCTGEPPGVIQVFDAAVAARSGDLVTLQRAHDGEWQSKFLFWAKGHWFISTAHDDAAVADGSYPVANNFRGVCGTLVAELHHVDCNPTFDSALHERVVRRSADADPERLRECRLRMRPWLAAALANSFDAQMPPEQFAPITPERPYLAWSQCVAPLDVASPEETAQLVDVRRERLLRSLRRQLEEALREQSAEA